MSDPNPFGPAPPASVFAAAAAAASSSSTASTSAAPLIFGAPKPNDAMRSLLAARNAAFAPGAIRTPTGTGSPSGAPSSPQQAHTQAQAQSGTPGRPSPGAGPHVAVKTWQSAGLMLQPDWALDVSSDECGGLVGASGARLRGEMPVFTDVEAYFRVPTTGQRVRGTLAATTYQLRFSPAGPMPASLRHLPPSFFCVPVASVRKVERTRVVGGGSLLHSGSAAAAAVAAAGPAHLVEVTCKDVRVLWLGFADEATADKMASHIKLVAFPAKIEYVHAFSDSPKAAAVAAAVAAANVAAVAAAGGAEGSAPPPPLLGAPPPGAQPGWGIYSPMGELRRLGVLQVVHPRTGERLYRVSELNRDFAFSPTYPACLVFPASLTDPHMEAVARFRSKARVPALTWMHPANRTTMWRCSQPRVGMGGNTCREDEHLIAMIREVNVFSHGGAVVPLLLADCRPRVNAMANRASGGGYEDYHGCQMQFLNIANIHAVRDSHRRMEALCLNASPSDVGWSQAVHETSWLYHIRTIMSAALFCGEAMHRQGQNVLVHCSDGWDRTAQVCGLVQVMLDPYFRTVRGFCILVAKEWVSFGHKFNDRAGHREEKDDGDISPVFLQFLDCMWQLCRLFPAAFEFDGRLMLLVAHHTYSCRFGTFLCNSEKERADVGLQVKTASLWPYIESRAELYRSASYDPSAGDALLPHPAAVLRHVTVWSDWFLRWAPFPSSPRSARLEKYADSAYDRAPLLAAMLPPVTQRPAESAEGAPPHAVAAPATASSEAVAVAGATAASAAAAAPVAATSAAASAADGAVPVAFAVVAGADASAGNGAGASAAAPDAVAAAAPSPPDSSSTEGAAAVAAAANGAGAEDEVGSAVEAEAEAEEEAQAYESFLAHDEAAAGGPGVASVSDE